MLSIWTRKNLELEFGSVCDGANLWGELPFDIILADKKSNSCGLQIADLIAHPIERCILNPLQENRAYSIIEKKFYGNEKGKKKDGVLNAFSKKRKAAIFTEARR